MRLLIIILLFSVTAQAQPGGYVQGTQACWTFNSRDHGIFISQGWDEDVDHIFIFFGGSGQTNCATYDGMQPGLYLRDGAGGSNWNGVTTLPDGLGTRRWMVFIMTNQENQPDVYAADITYFLNNIGITVDASWAGRIHYGGGSLGTGSANGFFNNGTSNPYRDIHSTGIWMSPTLYTVSANIPDKNYVWYGDADANPGTTPAFAINVFNQMPGADGLDKFLGITEGGTHSNSTWGDCMNISGTTIDDNRWIWMIMHGEGLVDVPVYPPGVRLYPTTENFFDLVQANKPLLWRLIDNDSTTAGLTDFFNGYIWDDYKQMGFWVNLDTFINHPRIRLFNSGSAGFTVTFQFFYSHMDTTRHSPEYSTSLPENSWKWVDSAVTREYDDSARWIKITLSSESAHNLKEIQVYGNKLGPAPSILPAPQDEPPDPGEQFQWTGKLDIDTLMDDAAAGQRIQNTMSWIYDETSAGNNKNLIYNIFSNSSDLTLLPNKRAGIPNSTYFANIRVHYEAWPGQALAKDIPFGSDSSDPANWQGVYDTYYGLAAKFGRNASANVTGYTFRNTNPGIGQDLIQELEINNEVMQHWNGRPKFHHTTVQILQQRAGYYGVKDADPTMKVNLGALTGLREDRAKAYYLHTLFNYKSPDSIFFDQLSVNEYKTTAGQQNQVGDIDGMTPETWRFYEHLVSFRDLRDRYYPGIPLLLTEDGYDTHDSEYNVTDISGRTRRETQAHWLWRSRQICRLARWSRYVHYSKIDGNSGPFATTGYSYNLYIEQNPKDTLPAYMEQVIPPDKWDGLGTVWVQIPKETYWWMTLDMQTLQGYNAWPTAIEMGDSTGVWCLRYTHQTNANETMLSVWMGTKDASTTSNYQVNIPGAISATLIHPQVGDKNGVESSLTVVDGVITIPTVWEGGDYVRVTLGEVENQAPTAAAGNDQSITLPTSQVTVNGSSSNDPDGTISTYLWSKISGPSTFTITNASSASTTITGLVQGTYVFRLTVTDNDSATDTDDITITVGAAPAVPGNRKGWFKGNLRLNKFRN